MKYLKIDYILRINRRTIKEHGGDFISPENIFREDALLYLYDAVGAEVFGKPLYPTLSDKAGVYLFNIIDNHIFHDGNKRTGLEAALLFLKLNGFKLKNNLNKISFRNTSEGFPEKGKTSDEILENFILEIASGSLNLNDCQKWLSENIEPIV